MVGLCSVGLLRAQVPKLDGDDKNVLERFKVAKDGDLLLLPVSLKGKTYQFFLDTGATYNTFDSSLPLGDAIDEMEVSAADGAVRLKSYDAPPAAIGSLSLKTTEPVFAFDFTKFRQVTGHEVYGFIGMPFLRRHVLRVDFDEGELLVLKEPGRDCGQGCVVTYDDETLPRLGVHLAGVNKQDYLLDTGYNGTCGLPTKSFDTVLNNAGLTAISTALFESLSGTSTQRVGRLKHLSIGDFTLRSTVATEGNSNLLGLGFCSRFVMTLDFPHDKVYLKTGKNFDRADQVDLSGLHILRKDGKVVVHSVDKRSAAEAAGIQSGDFLVRVDNTKTADLSMFQLRLRFSTETKKLRVTTHRGEKENELVLTLGREQVREK
jgi:hypothetical protein